MPACRYIEENRLAAILATKRSTGVIPEVNLREHVTYIPLPSTNKAAQSSFETQRIHHHEAQKSGISGPTERAYILQNFF